MKWPIIYCSGWPLKSWQSGRVLYIGIPIVIIRKGYESDRGTYLHELTHVKQWEERPFTHWIRYTFSKTYRAKCEAEAYAVQVHRGYMSLQDAATLLSKYYNLGISKNTAETLIYGQISLLEGI